MRSARASMIGRREALVSLAGFAFVSVARNQAMTQSPSTALDLPTILPTWSDAARRILAERLARPEASGTIDAATSGALRAALGMTEQQLLIALLPAAREYSRPPLSSFRVGAVALGSSRVIYFGANLEVASALNQSVHAEQSAIANAFNHDDTGITAIAVTAAPCGHCRQFLNEITDGDRIEVLVSGQPARRVADLLPSPFGPKDLGITGGMFTKTAASGNQPAPQDRLIAMAASAAAKSYAPHTKARSGCAIALANGAMVSGSYLENAAFNPSLGPLHAALVAVAMRRAAFDQISRVVLVESSGAVISQLETADMVLRALKLPLTVERVVR
jgi:cytidine deaminase